MLAGQGVQESMNSVWQACGTGNGKASGWCVYSRIPYFLANVCHTQTWGKSQETPESRNYAPPELCKYGVIHKWYRNLRRHLDAVIPLYRVFSYNLHHNLRFYTVIYGPCCKTS